MSSRKDHSDGARPRQFRQARLRLRGISHILALIGGALVFAGCLVISWRLWLAGAEVRDLRSVDQMRFVGLLAEEYWRTGDIANVRETLAGWDSSEQGQRALAELMMAMELKLSQDATRPADASDLEDPPHLGDAQSPRPTAAPPQGTQALQYLIALREALELPETVITLDSILRQSAVLWSAGLATLLMFAAAFIAFGPITWDIVTEDGHVLTEAQVAMVSQGVAGTVVAPGQSDGASAGLEFLPPGETTESGPSLLEQEFTDVEQELLEEELAGLEALDGASAEASDGTSAEAQVRKEELEKEEREALEQLAAAPESVERGLGGILSDLFEVEEEEQIDLDSLARDLPEIDTAELLEKATNLARTLRELFSS